MAGTSVGSQFFALNPPTAAGVGATIPQVVADGTTVETATLNNALAKTGDVYLPFVNTGVVLIDAPMVIPSNTRFRIAEGVTIRLKAGSNCNMLNNTAVSTVQRSVADAVSTATSTTIASASAAFTSADSGRSCTLSAAGGGGNPFAAKLTFVNSTTCTLSQAAPASASGQTLRIYNRDSNIAVDGGVWDRGANGGVNNAGNTIQLRRVDGIDLRNMSPQATAGLYVISLADVTNYTVQNISHFNQSRDGVHVSGPAQYGSIVNIQGTTGDDFVAFTPQNTAGYDDTSGNISDCQVVGLQVANGAQASGNGVGLYCEAFYTLQRIDVIGVYGACAQDNIKVFTNGGTVEDIVCEQLHALLGSGQHPVHISAPATNGSGVVQMTVRDVPYANNSSGAILIEAGSVVGQFTLDGFEYQTGVSGNAYAVLVLGAVTELNVRGVYGPLPGGKSIVSIQTGGSVTRATLSEIHTSGGTGPMSVTGTGVLTSYAISGSAHSSFWALGDFNSSTDIAASGSVFNTTGIMNLGASGAVRVASGGCRYLGLTLTVTAGGTLRSLSPELPIDSSLSSVLKTAGDTAYHTNAATTPFTVGPAVCDGTIFRPFRGFMASGTAVLAAGTKAVADTKITATSNIRCFNRTVGGTRGALWTENNAGVGFTIFSTNAADTSTVAYEVESY